MSETKDIHALFEAVDRRDHTEVERLLATVDVNVRHRWLDGGLLDHAVCDPVDLALMKLLLAHGAEHDARHPETGGTPLYQLLAASMELADTLEAIDLLIAYGADLNVLVADREDNQYTAVGIALSGGKPAADLLEALRARGGVAHADEL